MKWMSVRVKREDLKDLEEEITDSEEEDLLGKEIDLFFECSGL